MEMHEVLSEDLLQFLREAVLVLALWCVRVCASQPVATVIFKLYIRKSPQIVSKFQKEIKNTLLILKDKVQ